MPSASTIQRVVSSSNVARNMSKPTMKDGTSQVRKGLPGKRLLTKSNDKKNMINPKKNANPSSPIVIHAPFVPFIIAFISWEAMDEV